MHKICNKNSFSPNGVHVHTALIWTRDVLLNETKKEQIYKLTKCEKCDNRHGIIQNTNLCFFWLHCLPSGIT